MGQRMDEPGKDPTAVGSPVERKVGAGVGIALP